jgi:hypothetical protein
VTQYAAREGRAPALSIGGLETLAHILVIAATTRLGVRQSRRW